MSKVYNLNIDCADYHCNSSDKDDVLYVSTSKKLKQNNIPEMVNTLKTIYIVTSKVTSALDRTKFSNRNAMYILSATVQSLQHNIQDFTLNRESIRQTRRAYPVKIADEIKSTFVPTILLTVLWDEKLLSALM